MKFAEYIQDNYFKHHEPSKDRREDMETGWNACKNEILEILDKYRNSVGVRFAIEEINNL